MPALCRELGIDRFTAFPYFGLGYHGRDKYGPEMTLEACRREYDELYWPTVREAEAHGISLEIPLPGSRSGSPSGWRRAPSTTSRGSSRTSGSWAGSCSTWTTTRHRERTVPPSGARPASGAPTRAAMPRTRRTSSTRASARCRASTCRGRRPFASPAPRTSSGSGGIPSSRCFAARSTSRVSARCATCAAAPTRAIPRTFPRLERVVAEFAREHCGSPGARAGARACGVRGAGAPGTGRNRPHARPARPTPSALRIAARVTARTASSWAKLGSMTPS